MMNLQNFARRWLATGLVFGAGLVAAASLAPRARADGASFSPAQTQAIGAIVKSYLVSHPEVIEEAEKALRAKRKAEAASAQSAAIKANAKVIFTSAHHAILGNPDGKVVLAEFFDYNCPYCKLSMPVLAKLVKANPDLKIVLKDFPVLGPGSVEAARVAGAVRQQLSPAKFADFHNVLLGQKVHVGKAEALAVAKHEGADLAKVQADMNSASVKGGISAVMDVADKLNLTGTPTFVLGDDVIVGAVGYDELQTKISNMEKCGKVACS
ncbi:MAG: DsbA family protein [Hyphomicrobiales bacterium]|nr:DsbA family protein [Hyphomicrobiales bacterium]